MKPLLFALLFVSLSACYSPKKVGEFLNEKTQPVLDSLQIEDRLIHYTKYGVSDSKPTLLFIHEVYLDQRMWMKQVDYFSKDYQVISIDMSGHGKSTFDPHSNGLALNDIEAVLKKEAIETVHICAYGIYSVSAFYLADQSANGIASICLISPNLAYHAMSDTFLVKSISNAQIHIEKTNWEAAAKSEYSTLVYGKLKKDRTIDQWSANYCQANITNMLLKRKALPNIALAPIEAEQISTIEIPIFMLVGEYEFDHFKNTVSDLNKLLKRSKSAEIDGSGKLINLERPDVFNQLYYSFLKSI